MQRIERRHPGEDRWRELFARLDQGDESVGAFCRREGLSANTFYRWRTRLSAQAAASPAPQPGVTSARSADEWGGSIPRFVDLGAFWAPAAAVGRLEIKLEPGVGVVLHVVRG